MTTRRYAPEYRRQLSARIAAIHRDSRGTYGVPRIHAELAEDGERVAKKRVARLMRAHGLHGLGLAIDEVPALKKTMAASWFSRYFDRLGRRCKALRSSYGTWKDHGAFDAIGDLLEGMVATHGVRARPEGYGLYVSLETTVPPLVEALYRSLLGRTTGS